jgi:D-alanine--D-alanine ligase
MRMNVIQEKLNKVLKFDSSAVVEEWIEGRELTIPVIQGKAFPIVEIRPKSHFYDYASKYTAGASEYLCPAPLDKKVADAIARDAEKAFQVLECRDYGRLDVMLRDDGQHYFLEMNTLPGMTGTSLVPKSAKANGIEFPIFIKDLVLESWHRQKKS